LKFAIRELRISN